VIRALPRVTLQVWIVLFILFFGAEVVHLEPNLRVAAQVLYGVPLVALAAYRLRGPVDPLDWAVLGLLAVHAVVSFTSRDPTESLGSLGIAAAFGAWFLLMRRAGGLRKPIFVATATGLAMTLAFNAYLLVQEKIDWFAAVGGAPFEGVMTFPWESVNALPLLVLAAMPFVAWVERERLRWLLAAVVALSALVVAPLSLGRAGWLGLAIAGLVLLVLAPPVVRRLRAESPRVLLLGGVGIAIVVIAALVIVGPRVWRAIGETGRLLLWEQGINIFADNPVTGVGPGLYAWARLDYPPANSDLLELRLVHSVPIETLIDGGLLLALGLLAATAVYVATVLRVRPEVTASNRIAIASLVGFVAAFMVDDISYLPSLTAIVLTIAALLVPIAPQAPSPRRELLLPAMLALFAVIALPNVIAVDIARARAQAGRAAMIRGDADAATVDFSEAASAHPESGAYWLGLGMAQAYAGNEAEAIEAYERAVETSPGDPRGYAALAVLDPTADRIALLEAATDRSLGDPQYAVRLGSALAEQGDVDGAAEAWGRAISLQPQLLNGLPYAESGVAREAVAEQALRIIEAEPRPGPHDNLVALWDIKLAIDQLPPDADPAWRAVDAARHGDLETAHTFADEAIAAAPYEAHGYQAKAAVAAFACDREDEAAALSVERLGLNAYAPPAPDPRLRREFVYREASLGASQPPGVGLGISVERWPWSLIDRPTDCG
jgi:tetratricopeptide (TPR) repeat protein